MTFYSKCLLPRPIDFVMQEKAKTRERAKIVGQASGIVLEVGAGSGLNVRFLGRRRLQPRPPIDALIRTAGFEFTRLDRGDGSGARAFDSLYRGIAPPTR